jgi:hypothetical protein
VIATTAAVTAAMQGRGAAARTRTAADGTVAWIAIRAATIAAITAPVVTAAEAAIAVTPVVAIAITTTVEAGWTFRSDPPERP